MAMLIETEKRNRREERAGKVFFTMVSIQKFSQRNFTIRALRLSCSPATCSFFVV